MNYDKIRTIRSLVIDILSKLPTKLHEQSALLAILNAAKERLTEEL